AEIDQLAEERRQLEAASDKLRALQSQLRDVDETLNTIHLELDDQRQKHAVAKHKREHAQRQLDECVALLATVAESMKLERFPRLEAMRADALGESALTVESCDNREKD